jgi:hypothetical protein
MSKTITPNTLNFQFLIQVLVVMIVVVPYFKSIIFTEAIYMKKYFCGFWKAQA